MLSKQKSIVCELGIVLRTILDLFLGHFLKDRVVHFLCVRFGSSFGLVCVKIELVGPLRSPAKIYIGENEIQ